MKLMAEQLAKTVSTPAARRIATLRALPLAKGSGVSRVGSAGGFVVVSLAVLCVLLLCAAAPAFAAGPEAPEALKPEPIKPTEATLRGVINPKIVAATEPGTYQFLYKATKTDTKAECESAGASKAPASPGMYLGLEPEAVNEPVTGLTEGTAYVVCLAATTAGGTTVGAPYYPFQTGLKLEAPVAAKVKAGSITATSVEVEGELNPGKERKTDQGYFEILYKVFPLSAPPSGECEESATSFQSTSGVKEEQVLEKLEGLQPDAKYTFCIRVGNEDGEQLVGAPVSFVTPAAPPTVVGERASNVKAGEVTLEGSVNPNNQLTECHFQYGKASVSENTLSCSPEVLKGYGEQAVSTGLSGLEPNTLYRYRIVAKNGSGEETVGAEEQVKTSIPPETPTTGAATAVTSTTATLNGVLNPGAPGEAGTYEFFYRQSATQCQGAGQQTTTPAGVSKGLSPEPVSGEPVTGLLPGEPYTFCLLARNTAGETALGQPVTFTTATASPTIEEESVLDVAATSATFQAKIDPNGRETTYRFEYGTSTAYGWSIPVPDGLVGSGSTGLVVSGHPQDLSPNTEYHYRVVALVASRSETVPGSDGTFTTQPAGSEFSLPDGRQWELVSPANPHGALIYSLSEESGVIQAAEDGSGITYGANAPVELESPGSGQSGESFSDQAISVRGPGGWSTRDIAAPHNSKTAPDLPEYQFFSGDLTEGLIFPEGEDTLGEHPTLLSDEASEPTPYIRRESLCDMSASASECDCHCSPARKVSRMCLQVPNFTAALEVLKSRGRQTNLRHVVLAADGGIYEWSEGVPAAEALQIVNALPANEGGGLPSGSSQVGVGVKPWSGSRYAVSDDGSHVFWWSEISGVYHGVYMRDLPKRETVRLDVPQPGVPPGGGPEANFQIASSDGTRAFFTDYDTEYSEGQRLTAHSGTKGQDLYECEFYEAEGKVACKLTDLTPEVGGQSAEMQGTVLGASEDGSYVYFVGDGAIAAGAESGSPNLYEYHDGAITFVATLSREDETDWIFAGKDGGVENWHNLSHITARVSQNGHYLAFMSYKSLTGYDNRDANSGQPDAEVYLYDAGEKHLVCASCNPTGSRPTGVNSEEFTIFGHEDRPDIVDAPRLGEGTIAANIPGGAELKTYGESLYQPRVLSDSGRLFFNSDDDLVAQDVNGQEDLYEYEPGGVGDCTASSVTFSSKSDGCANLISSGTSPEESGFLDASMSGGDVFFLTTSKLASQDYGKAYEIYDAHECSASVPCVSPVVSSPPCDSGDSCKAAPAPQPSIFGAPASATFSGTGNVVVAGSAPVLGTRSLTRAQKLARALKVCAKKPKRKRGACRRQARKRYGAKTARKAGATGKAQG